VDSSLPTTRVAELFVDLVARNRVSRRLQCNNKPDFIADALRAWCATRGIILAFIEPDKPNQNAYFDRLNRNPRYGVLDARLFTTLEDVRAITQNWRHRYNSERAH
jgi:putative transposase